MKLHLFTGVRPNIVKAAPLFKVASRHPDFFDITFLHTGQHYNQELFENILNDLEIPYPDVCLSTHTRNIAVQANEIRNYFIQKPHSYRPDIAVVFGDANCTAAATLAMSTLKIPVAHVEAGLRCGNTFMKEESNRIAIDILSDYLFASETSAVENLAMEGHDKSKVFFTGNIMIDSLISNMKHIDSSQVLDNLKLEQNNYLVVTIHREENINNLDNMQVIFNTINILAEKHIVVFPIHPGTMKKAIQYNLNIPPKAHLRILPPLGYINFMALVKNSMAVVTDSGGIQEETTYLRIPCVTLRESTERPITVTNGTNRLSSIHLEDILLNISNAVNDTTKYQMLKTPELWDGKTAERIIQILMEGDQHI